MADLSLTASKSATTTTDPNATPVSSPTTTFLNPATGSIEPLTGTGTSTDNLGPGSGTASFSGGELSPVTSEGVAPVPRATEVTNPQIFIATALPSATQNALTLLFDYLPESVSFGVSADLNPTPIQYTSARFLSYDHTDIEEVSLSFKVVVGCNNCITYYKANTSGSNYLSSGSLATGKYERNTLISLAQFLYSLPLPATNDLPGKGMPPPTCRLKVGKMFSGVGAFSGCSIQFNGPYDYDGSPTDMDVSLRFLPSEFYDSSSFQAMIESSAGFQPKSTPTGARQVSGDDAYALTFWGTQTGTGTSVAAPADPNAPNAANTPNQGPELVGTVPESQVQGPQAPTPTDVEVAQAFTVSPGEVKYDQPSDTYTIGGTKHPGEFVRQSVASYKAPPAGD